MIYRPRATSATTIFAIMTPLSGGDIVMVGMGGGAGVGWGVG